MTESTSHVADVLEAAGHTEAAKLARAVAAAPAESVTPGASGTPLPGTPANQTGGVRVVEGRNDDRGIALVPESAYGLDDRSRAEGEVMVDAMRRAGIIKGEAA